MRIDNFYFHKSHQQSHLKPALSEYYIHSIHPLGGGDDGPLTHVVGGEEGGGEWRVGLDAGGQAERNSAKIINHLIFSVRSQNSYLFLGLAAVFLYAPVSFWSGWRCGMSLNLHLKVNVDGKFFLILS